MKVKFFSSFTDSKNAMEVFSRILEFFPESGEQIQLTDGDDYTHAVIMNIAMPDLKIPKENVLGLAFEPNPYLNLTSRFISYAHRHIGTYYIGDATGLPAPFIQHHGFMWYVPFPREIQDKSRIMSIIFSERAHLPGHLYRHQLVSWILSTNLPIDIYGRGCDGASGDPRIRGRFNDPEPYDGYMFSIAIENISLPDYISEKFINPLLYGTTPLYYGAKNAGIYFPDTFLRLTGDFLTDSRLIEAVCSDPASWRTNIDRWQTLRSMNLLEHLDNKYNGQPTINSSQDCK